MSRPGLIIVGTVLLGTLACDSNAALTIAERTREEQEVQNVIAAITDAFNQHDPAAWVDLATADAQLVTVRGETMNGVAEIEQGLTRLFQTRNRNASVRVVDARVRLLTRDVALAHVTSELSGVVGADGLSLPAQRELSLRVFVMDRDKWRITSFHNTTVQP